MSVKIGDVVYVNKPSFNFTMEKMRVINNKPTPEYIQYIGDDHITAEDYYGGTHIVKRDEYLTEEEARGIIDNITVEKFKKNKDKDDTSERLNKMQEQIDQLREVILELGNIVSNDIKVMMDKLK